MLQIEYPWVLMLLPLPWLVYRYVPAFRQQREAVRIPHFQKAVEHLALAPERGAAVVRQSPLQRGVVLLAWGLLTLAVARPVWLEPPISQERSARDLLLAVDASPSMAEVTTAVEVQSRFEMVQQVVDQFIARRTKDRIGLLLFAGEAYPQAPLTLDHGAVRRLLQEADVGFAGPNTAIGDAIGLAIKLFDASEAAERVLILLTDGNDTGSRMLPLKAAQIAADEGIVVHAIGVGESDDEVAVGLDVDSLRAIARITGGRFYRASDPRGLQTIYRELDRLTPERIKTLSHRPRRQLYHWPLAGLTLLLLLGTLVQGVSQHRSRRRVL